MNEDQKLTPHRIRTERLFKLRGPSMKTVIPEGYVPPDAADTVKIATAYSYPLGVLYDEAVKLNLKVPRNLDSTQAQAWVLDQLNQPRKVSLWTKVKFYSTVLVARATVSVALFFYKLFNKKNKV